MNTFDSLLQEGLAAIKSVDSVHALQSLKSLYLGPKGHVTGLLKKIKDLPKEEKGAFGQSVNVLKKEIENAIQARLIDLQDQAQLASLGDPIDPSLASSTAGQVPLHPLTQTRKKILEIFQKWGYSVTEGPELETEWFCFDALNIPENHPARNEQDTFFMNKNLSVNSTKKHHDERYLLRTHTSTVQIRTLLKEQVPLKVIAPGRVFRRDTVDATHNFNFHQIEGLCIDENISVVDLKGTLDFFVKEFFGESYKTRLRPSFFPFTEPGFEMDIFVPSLGKFKNQWIEVWGCGMVHPRVFEAVGLAGNKWQGFAFGFGLERLAMLLYGIDDVRCFYQNDVRFLKQF